MKRGDIIQSECLGFGGMETLIKAFTIFSKLRYNLDFHPTHCMIAVSDTQVYSAEAEGMVIKDFKEWQNGHYKYKIYRPLVRPEVMEFALAKTMLSIKKPYAWWQFEGHVRKHFREIFNVIKALIGWKWLKQKDVKKVRALITIDEVCSESAYLFNNYMKGPEAEEFETSTINNCELEHILRDYKQFYQLIEES